MYIGIILIALTLCAVLPLLVALPSIRSRKVPLKLPKVSFIIPTYNDARTIEKTFESLTKAYPKEKSQIIIVNDGSSDETAQILKKLQKKHTFKLIINKKNQGKVKSLNTGLEVCKHDIVFILDSDVQISEPSLYDFIARLEPPNVAAVSGRYTVADKKLFSKYVAYHYNSLILYNLVTNNPSAVSLLGGCSIFKRDVLKKIGGFKENMLTEDIEVALRSINAGYRIEQSWSSCKSEAPENVRVWYKQTIRWFAGGTQAILTHPQAFFTNPWVLAFSAIVASSIVMTSLAIHQIVTGQITYLWPIGISLAIFCIPHVVVSVDIKKNPLELFNIIPYTLLYMPVLLVVINIAALVGIYKFITLREGGRGW